MTRGKFTAAFLAAGLFAMAGQAHGQTTHTVNLNSITFDPADLCIDVGDTVDWVWITGVHNVESGVGLVHDGNFRSGDPEPTPASYSVTFDQAFLDANPMPGNNYPYYCLPHESFGMVGNITVNCATASATQRNCAPNPNVYTSDNNPVLGANWQATVDASGHAGATFTLLVGYLSELKFTIGLGTILVNITDPGGQVLNSLVVGGQGLNVHTNMIPDDLSLNGTEVFTQGVILGGGFVELTNAQDLILGM